jgi:hypothetical protein
MRSLGLIGLLLSLGIGFMAYQRSLSSESMAAAPPQEQIDVIGIRTALTSMGEAERQYQATRGTYATLDQLAEAGLLVGGADRRGYTFATTVDGARGFTITATPSDPEKHAWPTFAISEMMQVSQQ